MDLSSYRAHRDISLEQAATELGLSSKGYLSVLENRHAPMSFRLALRIERWSGGEVRAVELLQGEDAELLRWVLDRHADLAGAAA